MQQHTSCPFHYLPVLMLSSCLPLAHKSISASASAGGWTRSQGLGGFGQPRAAAAAEAHILDVMNSPLKHAAATLQVRQERQGSAVRGGGALRAALLPDALLRPPPLPAALLRRGLQTSMSYASSLLSPGTACCGRRSCRHGFRSKPICWFALERATSIASSGRSSLHQNSSRWRANRG